MTEPYYSDDRVTLYHGESPSIHSVQLRNATGRATAWMEGQR